MNHAFVQPDQSLGKHTYVNIYEKWKVGEKLGSNGHPCYIRIPVITNRVILRFKCSLQGPKTITGLIINCF